MLEASDAAAYRNLRLEALLTNPEAFGSTYEREAEFPLETVMERLQPTGNRFTLGVFLEDDSLIAIATFVRETGTKTAHKGNVFGMYVSPAHRGNGVGKTLMTELLRLAGEREGLEQINLTVVSDNIPAKKMYEGLGFEVFGIERNALKYNGLSFDEDWMVYRMKLPGR
ncbi:GNAT family N-acetyltransferase [Paenibacillus sp.]|uniref:GNAT family N-acetyltransferase n=1 Tax=Paenibacillus sp. TaxID=58172 RepID=UPI00281216C8|nr:GNAT family N-acetyltransferase [Paenibacillus sp.]